MGNFGDYIAAGTGIPRDHAGRHYPSHQDQQPSPGGPGAGAFRNPPRRGVQQEHGAGVCPGGGARSRGVGQALSHRSPIDSSRNRRRRLDALCRKCQQSARRFRTERPPGSALTLDGYRTTATGGRLSHVVCLELCPQEDLAQSPFPSDSYHNR